MEEKILGRIFAVKTTGGQEKNVVNMSEIRVKTPREMCALVPYLIVKWSQKCV